MLDLTCFHKYVMMIYPNFGQSYHVCHFQLYMWEVCISDQSSYQGEYFLYWHWYIIKFFLVNIIFRYLLLLNFKLCAIGYISLIAKHLRDGFRSWLKMHLALIPEERKLTLMSSSIALNFRFM